LIFVLQNIFSEYQSTIVCFFCSE